MVRQPPTVVACHPRPSSYVYLRGDTLPSRRSHWPHGALHRGKLKFTGIENVTYLDLSSNFITGVVLSEIGDLSNLRTLILTNNSFTGSIPPELGNVSSIFTLDLSFNSLFGALPYKLMHESITLSRNNFSGELPESLWSLSKLRFLDISYNNFTGSLPEHSSTMNHGIGRR
ncbi:Leucine-rich repeat receptor-like kinase protein FLORAL ORGAN NUMBER1 [Dendrobium catenatum]|uniref:Leucine-rich repeat receptor-like kinase protein FLORAL ORGAN NUMBER1 n=1 Tax=Dendrobium catenatum TaxID=906689 RepID=A0A2I0VTL2_9ASPA|nr:Leucine-rich repeat receptor-like kinase protein FLORAL ORGAN NUMBER1 [Dendrobium catenatum]